MKKSAKIVTNIPLEIIWNEYEELALVREYYIYKERIQEIISLSPIKFVVADVGEALKWIDINKCYDFWKLEVEKHLANNLDKIVLEDFPNNYAYLASEWKGEIEQSIILLEKIH